MSVDSISVNLPAIPISWRRRLFLLLIVACFAAPLMAAWLLVDRWRPAGSVQHGELLVPARPLDLRFDLAEKSRVDHAALRGRWVLIYPGSAGQCDSRCQTALYDMRQVRLALGKDMGRVVTLLLLDEMPEDKLRQWLVAEHAAMLLGSANAKTRNSLPEAFGQPGLSGDWVYLLDPLGNLLMRYPVTVDPSDMLKDLRRLLRLSKIG
ncbi:MAG: cytochrome oxidase assembly protein [Candidatus Competibacter sp.]|nr:cytochrome oxidase assembly protein [Candidatus Competibacter sp.]MDG4582656.1 cytochrome oxidase assembly protein [Candidatus Competibacter sp.]